MEQRWRHALALALMVVAVGANHYLWDQSQQPEGSLVLRASQEPAEGFDGVALQWDEIPDTDRDPTVAGFLQVVNQTGWDLTRPIHPDDAHRFIASIDWLTQTFVEQQSESYAEWLTKQMESGDFSGILHNLPGIPIQFDDKIIRIWMDFDPNMGWAQVTSTEL